MEVDEITTSKIREEVGDERRYKRGTEKVGGSWSDSKGYLREWE